jgi:hypothetical protein
MATAYSWLGPFVETINSGTAWERKPRLGQGLYATIEVEHFDGFTFGTDAAIPE